VESLDVKISVLYFGVKDLDCFNVKQEVFPLQSWQGVDIAKFEITIFFHPLPSPKG
jgi:hypothetical protein